MEILQVKQYHSLIADKMYQNATQKIPSMFYFMKEDSFGYPTEKRLKGYVVYGEGSARWFPHKKDAEMWLKDNNNDY